MVSNFFAKYPIVNDEILNLDWVIKTVKHLESDLAKWVTVAEELQTAINSTLPGMQNDITSLYSLVNTINDSITDLQAIRNSISGLLAKDTDLQKQIDAINTNWKEIDNKFDTINSRIDSIKEVVGRELLAELSKFEVEFYKVKFDLEKEMSEIIDRINSIDTSVYNPWAGRRVNQDENDKLIYADLADLVPTAEEYSELGLRALEYSNYELPAYEYAARGKKHLNMFFVFSPVYGFKQSISNVLTSIVNHFAGTMTADDYTALDLTADNYATLDITALSYYSFNTTSPGNIGTGGDGLTANQYSNLQVLI